MNYKELQEAVKSMKRLGFVAEDFKLNQPKEKLKAEYESGYESMEWKQKVNFLNSVLWRRS